jgi:hypothetical protein
MDRRLVALVMVLSIAAIGCGGSGTGTSTGNPNPGTPSNPTCAASKGTLTALVDGALWTSQCVPAASWVAGNLAVGAVNDIEGLALTANVAVPGNYTGQIGGAVGSLTRGSGGAAWTSGPGGMMSLVITRLDLQGASGTFSFVAGPVGGTPAVGVRNVTNGAFNVTF